MTYFFTALDQSEHKIFIDWLRGHLNAGSVTITFLKKDGSERIMKCTLNPNQVEVYEKKTERTRTINEDICPVFDLDKREWRSFRYDSVTRVEISIE